MEWLRNEQIKRENEDASQRPRLLKHIGIFIFLSKGCISGGNQPFSLLFLWGWVYSLVFAFFYVV